MQPQRPETLWDGLRRHGDETRRLSEVLHSLEKLRPKLRALSQQLADTAAADRRMVDELIAYPRRVGLSTEPPSPPARPSLPRRTATMAVQLIELSVGLVALLALVIGGAWLAATLFG
jgi:hypothetical protein